MSADAPTPTTKREVLIAREAFKDAIRELVAQTRFMEYGGSIVALPAKVNAENADALAAARYPLPTVTRPRTKTVPEHTTPEGWWAPEASYRVEMGVIHKLKDGEWWICDDPPTAPRVAAWQDLLNNPTETVEDDTP